MRHTVVRLAILLAVAAPASLGAQAARVGRLPVLELPVAGVGTCRIDPANAASRRLHVARTLRYSASDTTGHRLVSLSVDADGAPVMLLAMMGTRQGRRGESESVTVHFAPDGAVTGGKRSAFTTGTPTRMSDDRKLGLLAADTAEARRLASALRARCRA